MLSVASATYACCPSGDVTLATWYSDRFPSRMFDTYREFFSCYRVRDFWVSVSISPSFTQTPQLSVIISSIAFTCTCVKVTSVDGRIPIAGVTSVAKSCMTTLAAPSLPKTIAMGVPVAPADENESDEPQSSRPLLPNLHAFQSFSLA